MKTRFDNTETWETAYNGILEIEEMETTHIMNTIKMMIQKPNLVINMLIKDIETQEVRERKVWKWEANRESKEQKIFQSINNVTSLDEEGILTYVLNSPLVLAMVSELVDRGVNVNNYIGMLLPKEKEE